MKIAILGRTHILLQTTQLLYSKGYEIGLIGTSKAENFYEADEEAFERYAKKIGVPFFNSSQINSDEIVGLIKKASCDVALSMNWQTIIKSKVTDLFKHGILNIHAGNLPKYRGNAVPNWAILNNEPSVTLCLHKMIPSELDNGPILLRDTFLLDSNTYIGDIYTWLAQAIPSIAERGMQMISEGSAVFEAQSLDTETWLRCYPRRPEDSKIKWDQSPEQIRNLIRASSQPFSGAFTTLEGGQKLIIWKADFYVHSGRFFAMPGQVLSSVDGNPIIACNSDQIALKLTDISLENCKDNEESKRAILKSLRNRLV